MKLTDADIKQYRGMVHSIVGKRLRSAAHLRPSAEDLTQEGFLGLMVAAKKFDPSRGVKFSTYAQFWIYSYVRLGALKCHGITTGRSDGGSSKTKVLWKPDIEATGPDGAPITSAALPSLAPSPERLVILQDLSRKLRRRLPKGRDTDIYLTRADVDRNNRDVPLTQGCDGDPRQHPTSEGSLPYMAQQYGVSKQRIAQIITKVEAEVRAWGQEIEREAA